MKRHLFTLAAVIGGVITIALTANKLTSNNSTTKNPNPQEQQEMQGDKDMRDAKQQARIARRQARQAEYELYIDSIVLAHTFRFIPTSFQVEPAGSMHPITNPNFELSIYRDYADVNLPYLRGMMPPYQLVVINNVINALNGYTAVQTDQGWTITFTSWLYSANNYMFTLHIYKTTGSAQLSIASTYYSTVSYWGSIVGIY